MICIVRPDAASTVTPDSVIKISKGKSAVARCSFLTICTIAAPDDTVSVFSSS